MQLLCNLLEAVHLLPRTPDHAAAAQTIQRFEHRLAVLIQGLKRHGLLTATSSVVPARSK